MIQEYRRKSDTVQNLSLQEDRAICVSISVDFYYMIYSNYSFW